MMGEIRQAVWNRSMAFSVGTASAILCYTYVVYQVGFKRTDVLELITYPMALSFFTPFAALFPMLPYALRFTEEYNSGYIRFALCRESKGRYIAKKIAAAAFSGGFMMAVTFGIVFAVAAAIGLPAEMSEESAYCRSIWYTLIPVWQGGLVLTLKTALAFLFGSVWSMVCLAISTIYPNRYVAFIGTFLLYQFLWAALQGSLWNPVPLLRSDSPGYQWGENNPFVMQAAVLGVLILFVWKAMERRIENV